MMTLLAQLGLKSPLIQGPMSGGPSTQALAAAVSNAGALGSLGGAYLKPEDLRALIARTRALTDRPFAVNLFAPVTPSQLAQLEARTTELQIARAIEATHAYRAELGLPDPLVSQVKRPFAEVFEDQFAVVLEEKPAVFSFTFGQIEPRWLDECRSRKIVTIGTATSLLEAQALERSGVDAVVAQGIEAGGHRGIFLTPEEENESDERLATMQLTRLLAKDLRIPVIAAGGIMEGRGIAEALRSGAQAAQLGTAFLTCDESGTSAPYRAALLQPGEKSTQLTRAFSGRWARGLENRFLREMSNRADAILPFPAQNSFTRDIRNRAAQAGRSDFLSLWAGSGVNAIRPMSAARLAQTLLAELDEEMSGEKL